MRKQTVIITGASRGIGSQTARAFAQAGYNVVINYYKSQKEAEALQEQLPGAVAIKADVSDAEQVTGMTKRVAEMFGGIDVLVNNAGIALQGLFTDTSQEEWDRVFAVNVKGVFNCCRAVLPGMIRCRYGRIINISSMWGISGGSCEVCYSASKAAVIGLTRALAKEVGLSGVNVNCIAPGVIKTDMNSMHGDDVMNELAAQTALGRLGTERDVAGAILFLASGDASYITGQVISVDGCISI